MYVYIYIKQVLQKNNKHTIFLLYSSPSFIHTRILGTITNVFTKKGLKDVMI